ncbi:hypothetical protein ACIBL3_16395 [Kribbella sp. NPDC050124]|uniref:hypothetical protein n=1 Tax=Kribbella sp. NPDC050124 TaxID=3364114 RepID=UPI0037AA3FDE
MPGPTSDSRIYLLDPAERQVSVGGPAVVGPDGSREELPPGVYRAIQHVIEAMRAGLAVKVTPLRLELPIDEAADAIGIGRDDLRASVADGALPFRSTEYVDWVRLADVIAWDNKRREKRNAALQDLLDEEPWDEPGPGEQQS